MKYATISCTTEACSHKWATYVKFFFIIFTWKTCSNAFVVKSLRFVPYTEFPIEI